MPSLGGALEWLRAYARSDPKRQVQVLVTGSLYLVGDVLRLLGKAPK
jgi:folylpolyglutamate synthase